VLINRSASLDRAYSELQNFSLDDMKMLRLRRYHNMHKKIKWFKIIQIITIRFPCYILNDHFIHIRHKYFLHRKKNKKLNKSLIFWEYIFIFYMNSSLLHALLSWVYLHIIFRDRKKWSQIPTRNWLHKKLQ
jgi:hypothetical protein